MEEAPVLIQYGLMIPRRTNEFNGAQRKKGRLKILTFERRWAICYVSIFRQGSSRMGKYLYSTLASEQV
jgi:hypothetical protein